MAMTKEQLRERNFELGIKMDELNAKATLSAEESAQYAQMEREMKKNTLAMQSLAAESQIREQQQPKSVNQILREAIKAIREHKVDNDFVLQRDATSVISSGVIQTGEKTNMESAGLPLTIEDLINPLEMPTIYQALGIKVATGVSGQIQWPCLDSYAECSIGGELDDVATRTLDFSKISATPVKVGIDIEVSNEAVNDASFDLEGLIKEQINAALGRTLDARVLFASTALPNKPEFVGPLMKKNAGGTAMEAAVQSYTFTGSANTTDFTTKEPTYKDLKKMKGAVLKTGAKMAGFCYVMDAATYSFLEAQPKDSGSGRFIIEGGKIDGDPVYITGQADFAKKIVAGCWGYEALNQHGESHFIIDPYTKATKGVTRFILNADFSLTYLVSSNNAKGAPFVIGA